MARIDYSGDTKYADASKSIRYGFGIDLSGFLVQTTNKTHRGTIRNIVLHIVIFGNSLRRRGPIEIQVLYSIKRIGSIDIKCSYYPYLRV